MFMHRKKSKPSKERRTSMKNPSVSQDRADRRPNRSSLSPIMVAKPKINQILKGNPVSHGHPSNINS